jgi:hypothetical protein
MFEKGQTRAGGQRELADLNDGLVTTCAVDPSVPCTVHAHTLIPYATAGWGESCE